ncbi:MAG: hypothetical protein Q7S87_01285 [Agitococcus sp.]|nr:hypothetical protein [Agitococcus sp.]MDO9179159.1 hypothetical protein [Agitococcus sp.]
MPLSSAVPVSLGPVLPLKPKAAPILSLVAGPLYALQTGDTKQDAQEGLPPHLPPFQLGRIIRQMAAQLPPTTAQPGRALLAQLTREYPRQFDAQRADELIRAAVHPTVLWVQDTWYRR